MGRFLVHLVGGRRAAHLHLLTAGSPRWREQRAFRDAHRADPTLAHEYSVLKLTLASQHTGDREAYTAGKANLVRTVLRRSGPKRA